MEANDYQQEGEYFIKDLERSNRMNFIRKVYAILMIQLSITTLITGLVLAVESFKEWLTNNIVFLIVCLCVNFVVLIVLFCFRGPSRRYPTNYILAFIFTVTEAFLIANIAAFYDPITILIAAVMTLGVTLGVTLYACFTKRDYTTCGGSLFGLLIGAILFAIFMSIFYSSRPAQIVICLVFVIIYTFYIVYDTQLIAGKGKWKLSYDDYIIGALVLYIDIIMLFLYILRLFGKK